MLAKYHFCNITMGMEGPGGGGQEADPLAHLLEESGLEDTAENRQEAEEVKAAFAEAREKDAGMSPEQREQIEGEIEKRQFRVIDGGARFAAKNAALDSKLKKGSQAYWEQVHGRAGEIKDQANRKIGWYGEIAGTLTGFGAAMLGSQLFVELFALSEKLPMPENMRPVMYGTAAALGLGAAGFGALWDKWKARKYNAIPEAEAEVQKTNRISA